MLHNTDIARLFKESGSELQYETLPNIPKGDYSLYIVTRYAGGNTLLKERRRINYGTAIKII